MLTIAELARYAGLSVRTVRHYHQIGLLPEPPRDELGHRRYDARALIELRRIRTLTDAGVPLNRVARILASDEADRPVLLAEVDAELRRHQAELRRTRERLHALRSGRNADPRAVEVLEAHTRHRYGSPAHRRLQALVQTLVRERLGKA